MRMRVHIWVVLLALVTTVPGLAQAAFEGQELWLQGPTEARLATPAVAFEPSGGFFTVWATRLEGLSARFFDRNGQPFGQPVLLAADDPLGSLPFHGILRSHLEPAVAASPDRHVLVFWTEEAENVSADILFYASDLVASDVFAQRFDLQGRPAGEPVRLSDSSRLHRRPAASSSARGDTLVVWEAWEGGDGGDHAVLARMLDSEGQPAGAELRLDGGGGEALQPAVATRADGLSLVVWRDCCDSSGDVGIFGRLVDAAGRVASRVLPIHAGAAGTQARPAVAAVGNDFFVVWQTPTGEMEGHRAVWRIEGRLVGADGAWLGPEAELSSGLGQAHTSPALALRGGRELVLAWTAWVGDFQVAVLGTRVMAGRNGVVADDALTISEGRINGQFRLGLAASAAGRVLGAWEGFDEAGKMGVRGRFLASPASALAGCSSQAEGLAAVRLSDGPCASQ